jgi:hypothetical protein
MLKSLLTLFFLQSDTTCLKLVVTTSIERFGRPTDKKATDERTVTLEDIRLILTTIIEKNHEPGAP